jgi:hypothetical protein
MWLKSLKVGDTLFLRRDDNRHTVKMQKLSLMAGNALLYSRPTDEQITAIAEILGLAL